MFDLIISLMKDGYTIAEIAALLVEEFNEPLFEGELD